MKIDRRKVLGLLGLSGAAAGEAVAQPDRKSVV